MYTECDETAAVSRGTSHVSAVEYTTSANVQKRAIKIIRSCRITCKRSEPAGERRIALYKSDQQHNSNPFIVQELCESRGSRPGLSVLTSLLVSVDVKLY